MSPVVVHLRRAEDGDVRDVLDHRELDAFRWGEHDALCEVNPSNFTPGYSLGYGYGLLHRAERARPQMGPALVLLAADNVLRGIEEQQDLVLRAHLLAMSLRLTLLALKIAKMGFDE